MLHYQKQKTSVTLGCINSAATIVNEYNSLHYSYIGPPMLPAKYKTFFILQAAIEPKKSSLAIFLAG